MSMFKFSRMRMLIPMTATVLLVAACGGGGGASDLGVGSGGTGFISGAVTKGPVANSAVTAYGISSGQMGGPIGTTSTDANGNFTMNIGSYVGPVMIQVSGGSYTDEATGTVMPMAAGDIMTAVLPAVAGATHTTSIQVTPVTAMAQAMAQHMTGGMTAANIAAANTAMGSHFAVSDILHVQPMNPLVAGSGTGANQDAQNYGMTLAAMSQYAQTLGLGTSSPVVTAMMNDASDGILDGKAGSVPVQMGGMMLPTTAGTSGMGAAMNAFMKSTQNKSGVTATELMNKLNGAQGQISNTVTPMMNATVSGTAFNGPVSKAMVTAFAVNSGAMGAQIASVATDGQGNFIMPLGSYTGALMLQVGGATYLDAATRTTMTAAAGDIMTALLPDVASGAALTGVWVTPLTAMAQRRALAGTGGMTGANIIAANTAMGNYFSVSDILHVQPINPLVPGAAAVASQDARNYGMTLAAMSQYANSLGISSSTLVGAMMSDVSDGILDGKQGSNPVSITMGAMMGTRLMTSVAGTSSMASAMAGFLNSAANASGFTLTDMAALMQKLSVSSGQI